MYPIIDPEDDEERVAAEFGPPTMKKLGKLGDSPGSRFNGDPRSTVVLPPSGAVKSGLFLSTPFTGVPPFDEKFSINGVETPNAGVCV